MYIYAASVTYCSEFDYTIETDHFLLSADSFADAVSRIEARYGKTLESINSLTYISWEDEPFAYLPADLIKTIKETPNA